MSMVEARIGDLAEQVRGVTYGKQDASKVQLEGYLPVLRAGNITESGLTYEDLIYVPASKISDKQKIRQGDIIVAASSGSLDVVGKAAPALNDFDGGFGAFCKVLRPNKKVNPRYFAQLFKRPEYRRTVSSLAAGANINNLRNEHLDDMRVPVPSLDEQRRIAVILDHADALRARRREALAQLDSLTQSIFIEMFGDPATSSSSADFQPLESLLEEPFQNGAYFPKETYCESGGIEMVHMSDAFGGCIKRGHLKRVTCSEADIKKYALTTSDVLIARRSLTYEGAAKPCMIPSSVEPLIFESSFIRVRPDKTKITPLYLFHYLNNERVKLTHIRPYVTQSTISGINQSNLAQVPVMQPSFALQQTFANRIQSIETLKASHISSLQELYGLFASLQHRAFAGEL